MKIKFFSSLVALIMVVSVAKAQVPGFDLGIKAGANITKIGDASFDDKFRFGYHAGAFAVLKLSKTIQIQPEVLYSQYATKTSSDFDDVTNANNLKDVKLNYLSIPLLLNISPVPLLSFQVGPQFGILLNHDDNFFENTSAAFKSGDFSMVGGAQLNLANLKLSARYFVGLNDIGDLPNENEWKNQGFQVSVGFKIL